MEQIAKKLSWIELGSVILIAISTIFGCIACNGFDEGAFIVLAFVIAIAIIEIVIGLIGFFQMRKSDLRNAILNTAKSSRAQFVGVFIAFIMAIVGLSISANPNKYLISFNIVGIVLVLFTTSFFYKGFEGYRKDKENYSFLSTTAFLSAGSLVIFIILSLIGIGLLIANLDASIADRYRLYIVFFAIYSVLFVLAAIGTYVCIGLLTRYAKKYAPKQTVADSDAQILTDMDKNIKSMMKNNGVSEDPTVELRKYKKLLDDGIITQEEFDAKKKDLLGL